MCTLIGALAPNYNGLGEYISKDAASLPTTHRLSSITVVRALQASSPEAAVLASTKALSLLVALIPSPALAPGNTTPLPAGLVRTPGLCRRAAPRHSPPSQPLAPRGLLLGSYMHGLITRGLHALHSELVEQELGLV